jgi:DNA topoisomerase IA
MGMSSLIPLSTYNNKLVVSLFVTHTWTCIANQLVSAGFTGVMPWLSIKEELPLSSYHIGDRVHVQAVELSLRQTTPPGYLTESELIALVYPFSLRCSLLLMEHVKCTWYGYSI